MKTLFLFIAIAITATSFAQKGKKASSQLQVTGAVENVTIDFSQVGINSTTIEFTDLGTGIKYAATTSNGMIQTLSLPKHASFLVMFYMQNNEGAEINYWLDELIGITLQPGENRGVGTTDITVSRDQVFTFIRR